MRDYVFPIFEVDVTGHEMAARTFRGTGFFVGMRGYALTAAHVVNDPPPSGPLAAILSDGGFWRGFGVSGIELHPKEDVALLSISPPGGPQQSWRSIVHARSSQENSSAPYFLWGYPADTVYEIVDESSGHADPLPGLVYTEGHVRRRVSIDNLVGLKGSQFFELSDAAGDGCSGGPLLLKNQPNTDTWPLIGLYVGERVLTADRKLTEVFPGAAKIRGYALRLDAILDWRPGLLEGRSLLEESQQQPEPSGSG